MTTTPRSSSSSSSSDSNSGSSSSSAALIKSPPKKRSPIITENIGKAAVTDNFSDGLQDKEEEGLRREEGGEEEKKPDAPESTVHSPNEARTGNNNNSEALEIATAAMATREEEESFGGGSEAESAKLLNFPTEREEKEEENKFELEVRWSNNRAESAAVEEVMETKKRRRGVISAWLSRGSSSRDERRQTKDSANTVINGEVAFPPPSSSTSSPRRFSSPHTANGSGIITKRPSTWSRRRSERLANDADGIFCVSGSSNHNHNVDNAPVSLQEWLSHDHLSSGSSGGASKRRRMRHWRQDSSLYSADMEEEAEDGEGKRRTLTVEVHAAPDGMGITPPPPPLQSQASTTVPPSISSSRRTKSLRSNQDHWKRSRKKIRTLSLLAPSNSPIMDVKRKESIGEYSDNNSVLMEDSSLMLHDISLTCNNGDEGDHRSEQLSPHELSSSIRNSIDSSSFVFSRRFVDAVQLGSFREDSGDSEEAEGDAHPSASEMHHKCVNDPDSSSMFQSSEEGVLSTLNPFEDDENASSIMGPEKEQVMSSCISSNGEL